MICNALNAYGHLCSESAGHPGPHVCGHPLARLASSVAVCGRSWEDADEVPGWPE